LIGDHRQLPAFVQQCWFNFETTLPSIKTSLFISDSFKLSHYETSAAIKIIIELGKNYKYLKILNFSKNILNKNYHSYKAYCNVSCGNNDANINNSFFFK